MKFVICAIIKDEHRFLKEWIDYHLNIGFDHIYLYEDYGSKSHKDIVANNDKVTLKSIEKDTNIRNYHSARTQHILYTRFLQKSKKEKLADWVLYTDIDEFIDFDEGYNLERLCKEFEDYAGIWLSWKYYNANGHIKHPKGGVVESYTKEAAPDENADRHPRWQFKSFVNVHKAKKLTTLHEVEDGVNVHFESVYPVRVFEKAWINHYFSKSWEDFVYRMCRRGNMSNNYRTYDLFFRCNKDMLPMRDKLIKSIRYNHTVSTMWISKELKIISGGNVNKINDIKKKLAKIV